MTDVHSAGSGHTSDAPLVLAFYLPQFHLVPENDAWHGAGFTEWNVVAKSKPLFPGHRQPDLPGELGFYDLRVPETRYLQARLAREHGISGFLYYHYWFGGRRMLGRPFQEVLQTGQPDFPFALCWANESWYRRWQGTLDEMILEQTFSEEDDLLHIRWLIEAFKDPRYIRVHGRPLLAVYRPHFLPEPARTVELWRRECAAAGVEPPWLVGFETGDASPAPADLGFDAAAEFVPHHLPRLMGTKPFRFGPERTHRMYEYDAVASAYMGRPEPDWERYPCVATAWDNSPRRQTGEALVLNNATPEGYAKWLTEAVVRQSRSNGSQGVVFVNAWNEWAEGAHLEPGADNGRAYLEATRDVLEGLFGPRAAGITADKADHPQPTPTEDLYHDLYDEFVLLQQESSGFLSYGDRRVKELKKYYEAKTGWAEHQAVHLAEMNEWLSEQLQQQSEQMQRQLPSDEVPFAAWLSSVGREPAPGTGDNGDGNSVPPRGPAADAPVADEEDGERPLALADEGDAEGLLVLTDEEEDGEGPLVLTEEEEQRRDAGFNDPPGHSAPLWLVEIDTSE